MLLPSVYVLSAFWRPHLGLPLSCVSFPALAAAGAFVMFKICSGGSAPRDRSPWCRLLLIRYGSLPLMPKTARGVAHGWSVLDCQQQVVQPPFSPGLCIPCTSVCTL